MMHSYLLVDASMPPKHGLYSHSSRFLVGSFDQMEFEYQRNTMQGSFDFVALESRLSKIKEQLVTSALRFEFAFGFRLV